LIKFSEKQKKTINQNIKQITFELNEGTPRSGKTTADIFKMALFYLRSPDQNHIVTAFNQEQAFRMFFDGDGFGLIHIFANCSTLKHDDHGDHLLLFAPNGEKKIYYKGGGKISSVGGIRGLSFGSVVYLEFDLLNKEFIQESFRRTMAAKWRYHLAEQNPPAPNHPTLKLINRFEKAGTFLFRHWTPDDNPILTDKRKAELKAELSTSKYLLDRDWYGKRVMPQGVIYSMFHADTHLTNTIKGKPIETYFTADAGQSDATTCAFWLVTWHKGKHYLYRLANYYHSGRDTGVTKAMSVYAKEIQIFVEWCYERFDFMRWNNFYVDPAAKSLREELHLLGIFTDKADNNSSDKVGNNGTKIEVGIERVQSLFDKERLFLYDNGSDQYDHYHLISEFGMYIRLDNGMPIDKYNHACDELRYGCNTFYKTYIK